jgi:hypothetical protein
VSNSKPATSLLLSLALPLCNAWRNSHHSGEQNIRRGCIFSDDHRFPVKVQQLDLLLADQFID